MPYKGTYSATYIGDYRGAAIDSEADIEALS